MGNKPTRTEDKKEDFGKREKVLARRFRVSDKIIGKGSFATVMLGHDIKTKRKVAVRQISTVGLCPVTLQHLHREVELHPTMDHDHIVRVLYTQKEEGTITMVLEYVKDGSLLDYYAKKRSLHEFEVRSIFLQLLEAVDYMHSNGVVHRDIKLDNILIDASSQTVKLADFGFADRFDKDTLFRNFPGTMAYSPPEVLRGEPHRPIPRDVWSLGVLLYILLTGKYPFGSQPNTRTKNRILTEEPRWDELKIPALAKELLRSMLQKDPSKRITLKEIHAHPWCREGNPLLRKGFFRSASSLMADLMPQPADKPKAEAETLAPMVGAPEISVGA